MPPPPQFVNPSSRAASERLELSMVLTGLLHPFLEMFRGHWQLLVGVQGHCSLPFECGFPEGIRQSLGRITGLLAKAFKTSKLLQGKIGQTAS